MSKLDIMFPLSFSNSSLSSFSTCSLKGFRSSMQKLVGSNTKSGHLLAGGAFASACEEARKAYYIKKLSQEEAVAIGVDLILDSPDTGHAIKTNERVALAFRKYLKEFPFVDNFRPCELEDGSHAIEYEFSLDTGIPHPDLPDRNIMFTGILDGLYEKLSTSGEIVSRFVLDEKTTGDVFRISGSKCAAYPNGLVNLDKELNLFKTSGQMIGYSYAANSLGINIDSALIRRVPIMSKHEAAYELKIPITPFMREMWAISTFEFISELKDRYIYYRDNVKDVKGSYPHSVFYPTYSNSCNAWGEECRYMAGCLNREGGQVLAVTHKQMVGERVDGKRILTPLKEYKERFGL